MWRHIHISYTCVHMTTHLQLGHKHESKDAKRYTYQTQTLKPLFISDAIASVTELIAAWHCVRAVPLPHVAGVLLSSVSEGQALCGIQYDKIHGSLTER